MERLSSVDSQFDTHKHTLTHVHTYICTRINQILLCSHIEFCSDDTTKIVVDLNVAPPFIGQSLAYIWLMRFSHSFIRFSRFT